MEADEHGDRSSVIIIIENNSHTPTPDDDAEPREDGMELVILDASNHCITDSQKRVMPPIRRKTPPFYKRESTWTLFSEPLPVEPGSPEPGSPYSFYASPNRRNRKSPSIQTKRELREIHRVLSVRAPPAIGSSGSMTSPKHHTHHHHHAPPNLELCMEFCWCFQCCFQCCMPCIRRCIEFRSPEHNGHTIKTTFYELLRFLLYTPLVDDNEAKKITRLQIAVFAIRLGFELYKTMIGSYLTIFTPQKCGEQVCSLLENVVPKDRMEIAALTVNSFMAFGLLSEYVIEMIREKILRMYFETDQRLPVEKEYFTNLLAIIDTKKAKLLGEKSLLISMVFRLYRRVGIFLLSLYLANVCISAAVIYKNYYDKSSLFGFVTNALFIVFKMASILKIAIHSISMPYSAYVEMPVAFNSLKSEYIKTDVKTHFLLGSKADTPAIRYFRENKQYMNVLLEDLACNIESAQDLENPPAIRHRKSFG